MTSEVWRHIPGFEGAYEVSSLGRIRSLTRTLPCGRVSEGSVLTPRPNKGGYLYVTVRENDGVRRTRKLHRLVAEVFMPNPEGHPVVRHYDGDKSNNTVGNLRWGTHAQNVADSVRLGMQAGMSKTHCPQGHEYNEENTYRAPSGGRRQCKSCHRIRSKARYAANKEVERAKARDRRKKARQRREEQDRG